MARGDVETKTALLSKAAAEVTQPGQAAEATAAELRQSLLRERDRVAALAHELATARRDLETEIALSRKAREEAIQFKPGSKATTAELEQERGRSTALDPDAETAQRVIGSGSPTERLAGSPIIDQQIAEQLRRSYRANQYKISGKRQASASGRDIKAGRSHPLVVGGAVSWFGREEAKH